MDLKCMLAAKIKTEKDFDGITFPVLCSPKFDGIRMTVQRGVCLSRTLKEIPNVNVQAALGMASHDGLDGELIFGSPVAEDVFGRTTSVVMSDGKPIEGLLFNVFDDLSTPGWGFRSRLAQVASRVSGFGTESWQLARFVRHETIEDMAELLAYEEKILGQGYEGIMLRSLDGKYKHGRSTLKEGGLAAIKRFTDAEAVVIDTYEQEENTNEKVTNELGRSKRSSAQAGKVGKDTLGGFNVIANPDDIDAIAVFGAKPFNIGTGLGLTQVLRQELWNDRAAQVGKICKFKYQAIGVKDKPRLPIWLGFRDRMDM